MNIIQRVYGGVPECPDLIESDQEAMDLYRDYAYQLFDLEENLTDDELMEAIENDGDNDLYWWQV